MSTSIGIPIDGAGGRGFGVTGRGGTGGNLATDKGKGQAETVLGSAGDGARYGLKGLIGEACLVNPPCCSVPHIGVGIGWSSVGHSGDLVLNS